ncbi:MAG: FHA domain-containing protein [Candidatus Binataceae bacterium]|nr:FHA domain-containing protein [Candidatus Binataceae bacterium]
MGSDERNDFVIFDPTVSRQHATITGRKARYVLTDLGSANGTYLNGRKLEKPTRLKAGAELRFGNSRFVFSLTPPPYASKPERNRPFSPRLAVELVLAALVVGFAATQYALYLSYHRENASAIAHSTAAPPTGGVEQKSGPMATNPSSRIRPAPARWLSRVNHYRAMARVSSVTENSDLSKGDFAHARYLVKTFRERFRNGTNLGALMREEDPANPWYSAEGLAAAQSSDIAEWPGPKAPSSNFWAIDHWMEAPFHRLSILNPRLLQVGYGNYCQAGVCAAVLDTNSDAGPLSASRNTYAGPVEYPPDGAVIKNHLFRAEWPDPLTGCPGLKAPTGLPITLQLGAWMSSHLYGFTVSRDGAAVQACGFDSSTYSNPDAPAQERARDILKDYGAMVLVPRTPLTPGRYTVSITSERRSYTWSFTIK